MGTYSYLGKDAASFSHVFKECEEKRYQGFDCSFVLNVILFINS